MKDQFIQTHRHQHRVGRLCQTLGVSRSGYYAWRTRPLSARQQANIHLLHQLQVLHTATKERYGAVKLWKALLATGMSGGRHRVARLRREHGLIARRVRRFRLLREVHQFSEPAPNRLKQTFVAAEPNRRWAGDLTALATRAGWVYLAVLLDLYSRRVVGWAMSAKPDQHVALQALRMAVGQRHPRAGLIHHTDQGAQYRSRAYQQLVKATGLVASMSRKGNCYDNAVVESFFSTLKNELGLERVYHTREEARGEVFEFIEVFYNRQRLHQTLGYVSPVQYETHNPVPLLKCPQNRG